MSSAEPAYDVVVVGGGIGGLAAAALAQRKGLKTALLEAHTKLGGCAGYFERGPYTFDAGATALMGLKPGEPVGDLLTAIGAEFEAETTPSYRVHLPDGSVDIGPDSDAFEDQLCSIFPGHDAATRRFWRFQERVGLPLFRAASKMPRLPLHSASDALHTFRCLGLSGTLAAATSLLTVKDVLALLGLGEDRRHRAFVAMLLQDTAQAGPETVPFANAAVCLQAYRLGMSRPRGGMKALAEGIGSRFSSFGGDLRTATKVDRVEAHNQANFTVITRRRHRLRARRVVFNLPIDLAAALLGRSLEGRLARAEHQSRAAWMPSPRTWRSAARPSLTMALCSIRYCNLISRKSMTRTTC